MDRTEGAITGDGLGACGLPISRRGLVAGAMLAGVSVGLFGLHGASRRAWAEDASDAAPGGLSFAPGTYSAAAQGKFGPVNVEVTFSDSAITDVKIGQHEETKFISDQAFEQIPAAIVEHQSLDIDSIAGATLTSRAIIIAASDCVEQAGGDPDALTGNYEKPAPSTETVELEGDVVVVGAGGSGMVAALSAARLGAKKVILLEKSCNVGGNALVSGGYLEYVNAPDELREEMTESYEAELAEELAQAPDYMPAEDVEKLNADYEEWKASGSTKVFDSVYLHGLQYALQGEGTYDEMLKTAENIVALDEWLESEDFGFKPLCGIVGLLLASVDVPEGGRMRPGLLHVLQPRA